MSKITRINANGTVDTYDMWNDIYDKYGGDFVAKYHKWMMKDAPNHVESINFGNTWWYDGLENQYADIHGPFLKRFLLEQL